MVDIYVIATRTRPQGPPRLASPDTQRDLGGENDKRRQVLPPDEDADRHLFHQYFGHHALNAHGRRTTPAPADVDRNNTAARCRRQPTTSTIRLVGG